MDDHRGFKDRIYAEFARVGQALANEKRLELIDLLAQAPRHVDALAQESGMSVANVSQHLQVLRDVHLVTPQKEGTRVVYRLAGLDVIGLWLSLRSVGEERLAEVRRIVEDSGPASSLNEELPRADLDGLLASGRAILLDVRPRLGISSSSPIAGEPTVCLQTRPWSCCANMATTLADWRAAGLSGSAKVATS